jgi:hypothetical protein
VCGSEGRNDQKRKIAGHRTLLREECRVHQQQGKIR